MINANVQAQLRCDYYSGRSPWLQIQPVKREEIYLKPNIFMFHDMISDRDIERIQRIAAPNVKLHFFQEKKIVSNKVLVKNADGGG